MSFGVTPAFASGPDRLVDALMRNENYKVRLKAARALGRVEGEASDDALTIALGDPHPLVRAAVVNSLGRRHPPSALGGLCRLRSDRDDLVRRTLDKTLEGYGGRKACERSKVLVSVAVTGDDGALSTLVAERIVAQAQAHARMVIEGASTTELRARVDAGTMPGVKLMVRVSHHVKRDGAATTIACEMAQSIFDLKRQALRGSATQRAEVEVGGTNVSEREVAVQTQACLEALVPAVYDGLVGYVVRL